jgi:polyphosphate kinase
MQTLQSQNPTLSFSIHPLSFEPQFDRYINRELSWLAFNDRVLEEANDPNVPILERVKFLAIYANNLDEFFMVRVAALRRQIEAGVETPGPDGLSPSAALALISARVNQSQERIGQCFREGLLPALAKAGIFLIDETEVSVGQRAFAEDYFNRSVRPVLTPLAVGPTHPFPRLENKALYFCIQLAKKKLSPGRDGKPSKERLVLVQIPSQILGRFVRLPAPLRDLVEAEKRAETPTNAIYVIRLDDILRLNLQNLFPEDEVRGSYEIKVIRDAELDFDEEAPDLLESISKSLEQRRRAPATRFLYDPEMPEHMLEMFCKQLKLEPGNLFPGARYHSFSDMIQFPGIDIPHLQYPPMPPQPVPALDRHLDLLAAIRERDVLLHHPYQQFDYVIRLLEHAADDPQVVSIKMTLYRVSATSPVANALAKAARRGKQVTVIVELKARFDEEANIRWARALGDAGAHVIYGLPGLKIHCKLTLIVRREAGGLQRYCHLATGNYNDRTARIYGDLGLFTCREEIGAEVENVFNMLTGNSTPAAYKHLLAAPEHLRRELIYRIRREAEHAVMGKPSGIIAKLNALVDPEIINELYAASQAGARIRLIVRGICCLMPGVAELSENISVISIIDRFLEHARIYFFENAGSPEYFLASADWMPRNLDHRVEVAFPIYDPEVRRQVREIIDTQLADNVKARVLKADNTNVRHRNERPLQRSQDELFKIACQQASAATTT